MENIHDELVAALRDLYEDWITLVGNDLRENNPDVKAIDEMAQRILGKVEKVRS